MGISIITVLVLGSNYPKKTTITATLDPVSGKWAAICTFVMKNGMVETLLSSEPEFISEEEALRYFHDLACYCKRYVKGNKKPKVKPETP